MLPAIFRSTFCNNSVSFLPYFPKYFWTQPIIEAIIAVDILDINIWFSIFQKYPSVFQILFIYLLIYISNFLTAISFIHNPLIWMNIKGEMKHNQNCKNSVTIVILIKTVSDFHGICFLA